MEGRPCPPPPHTSAQTNALIETAISHLIRPPSCLLVASAPRTLTTWSNQWRRRMTAPQPSRFNMSGLCTAEHSPQGQ